MRADMAKVIVERPRWGSRMKSKPAKGYKKQLQKHGLDGTSRREGIKRPYGYGTKHLNEHLGPLRKFLFAQIGRPWDKVFSEICTHINRNSAVQDHVRDHVDDFVVANVILINGVPCHGDTSFRGRHGEPITSRFGRQLLYVCPKTGILRKVKPLPEPRKPKRYPFVRVNDQYQCHFVAGAWHLVTMERFPENDCLVPGERVDHLKGKKITRPTAIQLYGAPVYSVAKRRLSKKEMKQLPIPVDWQGR